MVLIESAETYRPEDAVANGINGHVNGVNGHGVNGYGVNGHVNGVNRTPEPQPRLFTLSARSEQSLTGQIQDLSEYLQQHGTTVNLDDLSYTLTAKRSSFPWRASVVAEDVRSFVDSLQGAKGTAASKKTASSTVFVFTGQGAQYFQMGAGFLKAGAAESPFSRSIQRSDGLLKSLGAEWSLVDELLADESSTRLNDSRYGQPASTAIQLALVDALKSWGVQPAAVIGHSSGEIAAAYTAGAITHGAAIRVAYERSFLSQAAKQRNAQPGAMMAAGIGKKDVEVYIERLGFADEGDQAGNLQVVVACINSPSSTTISGDALAVASLEEALKADGIFARRLKVDTAYHSHHMKSVGGDYLKRLNGLEATTSEEGVRYFSTVIGEEKREDFGASYWVDNLVSPVRFSEALDALIRSMGTGSQGASSFNFIEVGPHGALAGPIRQCLANPPVEGVSYKYISTLVRGQSSLVSLLETGSSLYKAGLDLDIASLAFLGISSSSPPKTLHNLPPYHWDHSKSYWSEPRLARDFRKRPHAHHDLLGLRTLTSTDTEPTWRIILSHETLPWLKDHVVDKFVVFPGSGYMAMAIEGLKQLQPNPAVTGYRLKNISFKRTLPIPEDTSVEVVMTFGHSETAGFTFRVASIVDGKWREHCDGHVSAVLMTPDEVDEVEEGRVVACAEAAQRQKLKDFKVRGASNVLLEHDTFYAELSGFGNKYGPIFAAVDEVRLDANGTQALSTITVPDVAATMAGKFQSPHTIHPTTLDATLHTIVTVFQRHPVATKGSMMPVFLSELVVSTDIVKNPGKKLEVLCDLHTTYPTSSNLDIVVFQGGECNAPKPVLTITNGELRVVGTSDDASGSSVQSAVSGGGNVYKVGWGLDMSSVTPADIEAVKAPSQCDVLPQEKVVLMNAAATRYLHWVAQDIAGSNGAMKVVDDYRSLLWSYVEDLLQSDEGKAYLSKAPNDKEELARQLSKIGVEGELLIRLGTNLTAIITGTMDPLALFLEDNLLYRVYDGDYIGRGNIQMAEYVRRLTFQKNDLRILELGAGTAGATVPLLEFCSPGGEHAFCAEYMYTDISSGFFDTVKQTKLKKWEHMLKFKTLDLEQDPVIQGFDEHGYDLVLASNVVHATKFLGQTLGNIHRILKPGGQVGIMEAIKIGPYSNMTFGLLPGWWAGAEDGRTRGPLLSIPQWHERLVKASFTGVDFAAYDHPPPDGHSSFFLSTAVGPQLNGHGVNGHATPTIEFLNTLPENHVQDHAFGAKLREALEVKGFQLVHREWSNTDVDETGSYIILDSVSHPFLVHASAAQFDHIIALLAKNTRLYWITLPDAAAVEGSPAEFGIVTGFSRVARSEYDNLELFNINVQDKLDNHASDMLTVITKLIVNAEASTSASGDRRVEYEYTLKDGKLHIQRLVANANLSKALPSGGNASEDVDDSEQAPFHQADRPLKLVVEKPGLLNSLRFMDDELATRELEPDQVEVQMFAHGVNFKDQFIALGQMKANQVMPGEGAGVISRLGANWTATYQVGQRVAVATGTPYASRCITSGYLVHPIPDSMSFNDAASISIAFSTAYYGLVHCANLSKGQSVLIHAASGGLGQAALMIAQHIGVSRIFVTVGSRAKKQLLMDKYGIPENHIFSSRTTNFQGGILQLTDGEGVDVALNSLAGDALRATWHCIATMGTFVEVGKTDIYQRNQLDMEPFDKNIRFAAVDLTVLASRRPAVLQKVLQDVFRHIQAGHMSPLPVTSMQLGEIEQAFRSIQMRKHTGKIVLESGPDAIVKARKQPLKVKSNGTYVIFGGLGGLGKHLCRFLLARGARYIAVASRRALGDEEKAAFQAEVTTPGSETLVKVMKCDITVASEVSGALADLKKDWPPVVAIFNLAMVLADRTLPQLNLEDFHKALMPKYMGTHNISNSLDQAGINVDFFINFASVSGLLGLRGQANYAAGNAFQDMFVQAQAARGRTNYISLDLPAIDDSEAVQFDMRKVKDFVIRQGCELVSWNAVAALLDYAMSGQAAQDGNFQNSLGLSAPSMMLRAENQARIAPLMSRLYATGLLLQSAGPSNASAKRSVEETILAAGSREEAGQLILEAVRDKVASLTAADPEELNLSVPIIDLGLDSLVAIELKNWVTRSLKAKVQTSDIMECPCLTAFATLLVSRSTLLAVEPSKKGSGSDNAVTTSGSLF